MTSVTNVYEEQAPCEKFLISVEDYHRMGAIGIFDGRPRVELIDGEILVRSPISPYHNSHVSKLSAFFHRVLSDQLIVWTQNSVRLDAFSEPEPDVALLKMRDDFYKDAYPSPPDIYLLVEVAVTTLQKDRILKLEKYARSGIPEYWIVIPEEGIVEVHRRPAGAAYQEKLTYTKADHWRFEPFALEVWGSDLLI